METELVTKGVNIDRKVHLIKTFSLQIFFITEDNVLWSPLIFICEWNTKFIVVYIHSKGVITSDLL